MKGLIWAILFLPVMLFSLQHRDLGMNIVPVSYCSSVNSVQSMVIQQGGNDFAREVILRNKRQSAPFVVELSNSSAGITIGETVTLQFRVNESILSWSIQCEDQQISSSVYKGFTISTAYRPGLEYFQGLPLTLWITDWSGIRKKVPLSMNVKVADPSKPHLRNIIIPNYIGTSSDITMNIIFDTGLETTLSYWVTWNLIPSCSAQPVASGRFQMDIPSTTSTVPLVAQATVNIRGISLNHLGVYQMRAQIGGYERRGFQNANDFIVDLTPPAKLPITKKSAVMATDFAQSRGTITSKISLYELDNVRGLDLESGINTILVQSRSTQRPYWVDTAIGTLAMDDNITWSVTCSSNPTDRLSYRALLQNRAGLWSAPSEEWIQNVSAQSELIEGLFNAPNPFDSRLENTTIYYSLSEMSDIDATIYDLTGRMVNRWHFAAGSPGGSLSNSLNWNGANLVGDKVSRGIYLLILKATAPGKNLTLKYKIAVIH